jgi:hypothetical protein
MEFIVALLDKLYTDRNITLSAAASETYYATLQQYHGWIVTGTFTVALKLVPSRCSVAAAWPAERWSRSRLGKECAAGPRRFSTCDPADPAGSTFPPHAWLQGGLL